MKTFIILLVLAFYSSCWAGSHSVAILLGSGDAGITYLVDQDYNATGTPSGYSTSGSGSTINYDDTTDPLEGAQSLTLMYDTGIVEVLFPTITGQSTYCEASLFRFNSMPVSPTTLMTLRNTSGGGGRGTVLVSNTGAISVTAYNGTQNNSSDGVFTEDAPIYIRVCGYSTTSDGATDGILTAWTSSNGSSWSQVATSGNGNFWGTFSRSYHGVSSNLPSYTIDRTRVANALINY